MFLLHKRGVMMLCMIKASRIRFHVVLWHFCEVVTNFWRKGWMLKCTRSCVIVTVRKSVMSDVTGSFHDTCWITFVIVSIEIVLNIIPCQFFPVNSCCLLKFISAYELCFGPFYRSSCFHPDDFWIWIGISLTLVQNFDNHN